ncbi:MAG: HAD family hydrolase [Wenzhouxiangella sp.]|nr:MAG: HAD family hydrolase [Wenzhouxiangella sp.]
MSRRIRAVLFDLDGTLVDSAPDLLATLAWLRRSHGLPELQDYQSFRHLASRGALGMIEGGFADRPDLDRTRLRSQFLDRYAANLWVESRAFDGIEGLLQLLKARDLRLGVVTNKLAFLAEPLIRAAGWQDRLECVIGGDTAAFPKPHPAPVLEACRRLSVQPGQALMVGDDVRDIRAGLSAGSLTAVAGWGYLGPDDPPQGWGAHHVLARPTHLMEILESSD